MPVQLTPNGTYGGTMPKAPRWLTKVAYAVGPIFFRLRGLEALMLTTVGSRSGKEHTIQLSAMPDGDNAWIIIASSGGTAKHPAWYFNMARNPDKVWVRIRGRRFRVEAESLTGAERESAWQRMAARWPGYNTYTKKTDREIPVIRLTAAAKR